MLYIQTMTESVQQQRWPSVSYEQEQRLLQLERAVSLPDTAISWIE